MTHNVVRDSRVQVLIFRLQIVECADPAPTVTFDFRTAVESVCISQLVILPAGRSAGLRKVEHSQAKAPWLSRYDPYTRIPVALKR